MNGSLWVAAVVFLTLVAYFYRGWSLRHSFSSIEDFFNYSRSIPPRLFSDTFIATNVTFTSIFLVVAATSYERGNLTLWIIIAWILGLLLFRKVFPKISPFFDHGHTLHEFLGQRYNSQALRRLASISTIIVFLGTLGIEFWGVVILLKGLGLVGSLAPFALAIGVALLTAVYTALGGFKAAVHTDRWQLWLIVALTVIMYLVVFNVGGVLPSVDKPARIALLASVVNPSTLFSDIVFAIAMLILFVPFNFCVMDMWQRCTATQGEDRLRAIRSVGSWKTCVTFAVIFLVPILVGLSARTVMSGASFSNNILVFPEFLKQIAGPPWLRIPMLCVIYTGFFAALMSTADTLLINSVYSFMYDVLGPIRRINFGALDKTAHRRTIAVFRFWVLVFALLAVPLIFIGLTVYQLVLAVFSSQIVLFIPIIYAIYRPQHAPARSRGACWSVVTGFLAAVICVNIGRLVDNPIVVDGTPVFAFVVSALVFFSWPRRLSDISQEVEDAL